MQLKLKLATQIKVENNLELVENRAKKKLRKGDRS